VNLLKAPFPWFGGKSRASDLIWSRFGTVVNYVEPFAGSLAVLLQRPQPFTGSETVNDKDALLRIAVCGYESEHRFPDSWTCAKWKARCGYDGQSKDKSTIGANRAKERIWFSPHCVKQELPLFEQEAA